MTEKNIPIKEVTINGEIVDASAFSITKDEENCIWTINIPPNISGEWRDMKISTHD